MIRTLMSAASVCVLCLTGANVAMAEDGIEDEVIVQGQIFLANEKFSGTKTPTPIIDVPQSISVISADKIQSRGFSSIADVIQTTPGISVGQGEGHRDQITIRGQNTTADFFIDGLRDDVQYFRPLYNLKQIEILRGSNAMIFGRGGGGGVINRVTKTPEFIQDSYALTGSVDSHGRYSASADGNFKLSDQMAARVNGFYEGLNNHRDFFNGERFAINPTLAIDAGEDSRFNLFYEYVDDNRTVDRGVPSLNGSPLKGFDETFFGDPELNRTTLQAHIFRGRLDHKFANDWSFNGTAQYADYDKLYQNLYPVRFDDTALTTTLDGYRDMTDRHNLILQGNLVGELGIGRIKHLLLIGAEYGDQATDNARADALFTLSQDDQITFGFTDPMQVPDVEFPAFTRDRSSDVKFASFYFQDQIDIGDHFKLIGGLRYDRFDVDVVDQIEVADGAADGNDGLLGRVDEEISPRLGLIYKPQDNISVYTSYSQSFLPRSGDQFLSLSLTSEALGPEEFRNYEAGIKWDLLDDLSVTAALFRLDRESGTTVDPSNPDNTILIGSRTEGLEFQLSGHLTENWSFDVGYSYLDGKERGRVVGGSLNNRNLAQVPDHKLSIWSRFAVTDQFEVAGGVLHQAGQFASISNAVTLPDFTRVDAAAYYNISDTLRLQLNLENLFNTDYFPDAHNDNNISTGKPRSARLTLTVKG